LRARRWHRQVWKCANFVASAWFKVRVNVDGCRGNSPVAPKEMHVNRLEFCDVTRAGRSAAVRQPIADSSCVYD
jgi:hypothetical protein